MATPTQNQARLGPPLNVLHDENIPNTLGGIGPPATGVGLRLPVGSLVAVLVLIVAVLVILVER
jgi:hypothetical protein